MQQGDSERVQNVLMLLVVVPASVRLSRAQNERVRARVFEFTRPAAMPSLSSRRELLEASLRSPAKSIHARFAFGLVVA